MHRSTQMPPPICLTPGDLTQFPTLSSAVQQQSDSQGQPSSQLRCADVTISAAACEGAGDSIADEPSSSAASAAANGASSASSQQQPHHHQDITLRDVLGVATLMPRIAQHVTSYSQLAYFRVIDTDRHHGRTQDIPVCLSV
ncbi:unnamed protein product [Vitrella brassicaformis CCMP3155]|uniref:Uncharacterized protein n=1 Tax=Vitrella brassicaformis (strain CCMP3155) TaxID=1169540 RepID=A0A0G4EY25_VITBC|nr:unnamed protein product [Vitrella brassicaformis CCMP3155]|eukprot:CEM03529.1 unnamed protein product [Vitrella brassicaformis CCMP3155]